MSYAIPLPPRPRLDYYKKLARELLRASSDVSPDDAVRAWAMRWLEASNRLCGMVAAPPTQAEDKEVEIRWQKLRKTKGGAPPLLADAQFFLAREHGFLSWPKFAEQVRALENKQSEVTIFEAAADAVVAGEEHALETLLRDDRMLVNRLPLRE